MTVLETCQWKRYQILLFVKLQQFVVYIFWQSVKSTRCSFHDGAGLSAYCQYGPLQFGLTHTDEFQNFRHLHAFMQDDKCTDSSRVAAARFLLELGMEAYTKEKIVDEIESLKQALKEGDEL